MKVHQTNGLGCFDLVLEHSLSAEEALAVAGNQESAERVFGPQQFNLLSLLFVQLLSLLELMIDRIKASCKLGLKESL